MPELLAISGTAVAGGVVATILGLLVAAVIRRQIVLGDRVTALQDRVAKIEGRLNGRHKPGR